MGLHWYDMIALVALGLLIFGPKRLPEMGASLGKTIREFQKSMREVTNPEPPASISPSAAQTAQPIAAAAADASVIAAAPTAAPVAAVVDTAATAAPASDEAPAATVDDGATPLVEQDAIH